MEMTWWLEQAEALGKTLGAMTKCCGLRDSGGFHFDLRSVFEFHPFDYIHQTI